MSLHEQLSKELEQLRAQRDDMRVRIHLAKLEARDLWDDMEKRWNHAETKLERLSDAGHEIAEDVARAAEEVVREMRDGYEKIRSLT